MERPDKGFDREGIVTPDEKVLEAMRAVGALSIRDMDLCTPFNLRQLGVWLQSKNADIMEMVLVRLERRLGAVESKGLPPGIGVSEPPSLKPGFVVCPKCRGKGIYGEMRGPRFGMEKCDRCRGAGCLPCGHQEK